MPNNYIIQYTSISRTDLINILDYIAQDNVDAALKQIDTIEASVKQLIDHPFSGSIPNDANIRLKGYRFLVVGSYNVFYIPNKRSKTVTIYRVLSARQNYKGIL